MLLGTDHIKFSPVINLTPQYGSIEHQPASHSGSVFSYLIIYERFEFEFCSEPKNFCAFPSFCLSLDSSGEGERSVSKRQGRKNIISHFGSCELSVSPSFPIFVRRASLPQSSVFNRCDGAFRGQCESSRQEFMNCENEWNREVFGRWNEKGVSLGGRSWTPLDFWEHRRYAQSKRFV